jgi:hypothetical protein
MKTENTCVNCAALECSVRLDCEDNELPTATQEPIEENEDTMFRSGRGTKLLTKSSLRIGFVKDRF